MQPAVRRAVDLFLPVSRAVAHDCGLDAMGLPYEVMPNFLDDELAAPAPDQPPAGLPEGPFVLFVGDLVDEKGIDLLLDAYAGLEAAPPLVLIGRPYSERLSSLPPNVLMLGPCPHDQVLSAWRRCSVGVVPSIGPESFGLAALEAQAAGKPVIATRVGGLDEVVVDAETGVLVPPGDVGALRGALRALLSDEGARARMGRSARRHAARFAASQALPRMEDVYTRVLRDRAGPTGAPR
jgi:glycosyltransferase involved in cell wall biosynthesis